jgi:Protein of unknown function (DUF3455)/PAP2 superfamily
MNRIKKISVHSLAAVIAVSAAALSIPPAFAASDPQTETILDWNRVGLEVIERWRPTQHLAARLMSQIALSHNAVMAAGIVSPEARATAIAAAARRVITDLVPSQAGYAEERFRAAVGAEAELGDAIARRVLADARADGFSQTWTGSLPQAADAWRSLANPPAAPAYPAIGGMRTMFAPSASAYRPAPPPVISSTRFAEDLAEVRRLTTAASPESLQLAKFYDMTTGVMAAGFWNEQASELIRRNELPGSNAASVLASVNGAMVDALAACHDAKYTYWVPRPSQADPAIKPLIGVPNHPSYPSNHSCLSTAAARVLAHFFPGDGQRLEAIATEAGESRIHGGLHYRFDVTAGERIGQQVAAATVERHPEILARAARTAACGAGCDSLASAGGPRTASSSLRPAQVQNLAMIVPARGVQIYECRPVKDSKTGHEWSFVAPEADLFDVAGKPIGRHFAGPHWEYRDGSRIAGTVSARQEAPVAGSIPWLLLSAKTVAGEGVFSRIASIQRVNTVGGLAPENGCDTATVGATARVPYTADYYLFAPH